MALVLVGNRRKGPSSWTKAPPGSLGFGLFRWDGALTPLGRAAEDLSVGMAFHDRARDVVYALDEALTLPGWPMGGGGQVVAFRVDRAAGTLTEFSRSPSFGTLPSHATQDTTGRFLIVTHHTGHTPVTRTETGPDGLRIVLDHDEAATVLFPLDAEGRIGAPCDIFRHSGRGALPGQTHPQLHCVVRAPGRDLFVICDKGADAVHLFGLDAGRLVHRQTLATPPGSSPRYCVFDPDRPVFHVNFETAALLHSYELTDTARLLAETPVPGGGTLQSDLILHPDGRHLYTLVRGIEAVAIFALRDGLPRHLRTIPLNVANPRGAAIPPEGGHLLVAAVVGQAVTAWPLTEGGADLGAPQAQAAQPAPGNILFL